MPQAWYFISSLYLCVLLSGCARCRYCCPEEDTCSRSTQAQPLSAILPAGQRGALKLSLDSTQLPQRSTEHDYRMLTPRDCQCQAVERSALGNMLDEQACRIAKQSSNCSPCDVVLIDLLQAVAQEARNQSAGAALELYYTIAQLEAQRDLLDQSIDELATSEEDVTGARKEGLTLPLKSEDVTLQRIEAEKKRVQLEIGITRANRELARLLGAEWGDASVRIWPETDLAVVQQTFNIENEVAQGVAGRPEIAATRRFACSECLEHLPTMRQIVAGTSAFLAVRLVPGALLFAKLIAKLNDDPIETAQRQQQLLQLADQQELQVRDNIRLAIETIGANYDQAIYARRLVQHWDVRVGELEKAREVDKSEPADVTEGKLKRLQAKSNLVESVIAWQIAQVKLREAQGSLVAECGGGSCGPAPRMTAPGMTTLAQPATASRTRPVAVRR